MYNSKNYQLKTTRREQQNTAVYVKAGITPTSVFALDMDIQSQILSTPYGHFPMWRDRPENPFSFFWHKENDAVVCLETIQQAAEFLERWAPIQIIGVTVNPQ